MELENKKNDERVQISIPGSEILGALHSDTVPKVYANGFTIIRGNSDINIVWQQHGKPVGVSQMSFTLAKTLNQKLGGVILKLEQATEHDFLTTDEIDDKTKEG